MKRSIDNKAFFRQAFQQFLASIGDAPEGTQFGFIREELRQFAVQHFHELLRRHRGSAGMPE